MYSLTETAVHLFPSYFMTTAKELGAFLVPSVTPLLQEIIRKGHFKSKRR